MSLSNEFEAFPLEETPIENFGEEQDDLGFLFEEKLTVFHKYRVEIKNNPDDPFSGESQGTYYARNKMEALKRHLNNKYVDISSMEDNCSISITDQGELGIEDMEKVIERYYEIV